MDDSKRYFDIKRTWTELNAPLLLIFIILCGKIKASLHIVFKFAYNRWFMVCEFQSNLITQCFKTLTIMRLIMRVYISGNPNVTSCIKMVVFLRNCIKFLFVYIYKCIQSAMMFYLKYSALCIWLIIFTEQLFLKAPNCK